MAEVAEVDWERDLKAGPVQAEESVVDLERSVPDSVWRVRYGTGRLNRANCKAQGQDAYPYAGR